MHDPIISALVPTVLAGAENIPIGPRTNSRPIFLVASKGPACHLHISLAEHSPVGIVHILRRLGAVVGKGVAVSALCFSVVVQNKEMACRSIKQNMSKRPGYLDTLLSTTVGSDQG